MARIPCRGCRKLVNVGTKTCPYCGADLKGLPVGRQTSAVLLAVICLMFIVAVKNYDSPGLLTGVRYDSIIEKGYFKDGYRNRIRSYMIKSDARTDEIRSHAEQLTYSNGELMAAYYYTPDSSIPDGALTMSNSVQAANSLIYDSPSFSGWKYAYIRFINGSSKFVDCATSPGDDLCKGGRD